MTTLITGATGFIGSHLVDYLLANSSEEICTIGLKPSKSTRVKFFPCRLDKISEVSRALKRIKPVKVYHLAGSAKIDEHLGVPDYFLGNCLPTLVLLRAIEVVGIRPQLFFASSAHVYGNSEGDVNELSTPHPMTPYGFTKFLAEEALRTATVSLKGIRVVVGRFFNCIGPGQGPGFVVSDFCRKLVNLKEPSSPLEVGALNPVRRFVDVRDIVTILPKLLILNLSPFEIFNIAPREHHSIGDILNRLIRISGKSPKVESSATIHANAFSYVNLNVEKLFKFIPNLSFRNLGGTLKDMYEWEYTKVSDSVEM